jgi:hypothetical protein
MTVFLFECAELLKKFVPTLVQRVPREPDVIELSDSLVR